MAYCKLRYHFRPGFAAKLKNTEPLRSVKRLDITQINRSELSSTNLTATKEQQYKDGILCSSYLWVLPV